MANISAAETPIGAAAALAHPDRIRTPAAFTAALGGKTTQDHSGRYTFGMDGVVTGKGDSFDFRANYAFVDGFYCRTNSQVTTPNGTRDVDDDCQVVVIQGDTLTLVRNRGEGERRSSTIL
ncbi:MAG: hypothetical protein ACU0DW_04360 [Shimia sp.]